MILTKRKIAKGFRKNLLSGFFIYTLLFFVGCIFPGTGTGNPLDPTFNSGIGSQSGLVFLSVCDKLTQCFPELVDSCASDLSVRTEFAAKLGLVDLGPISVSEIVNLEASQKISANASAADSCQQEIKLLSCTDPLVQAAYDPAAAVPLAAASEMLSPVCENVF